MRVYCRELWIIPASLFPRGMELVQSTLDVESHDIECGTTTPLGSQQLESSFWFDDFGHELIIIGPPNALIPRLVSVNRNRKVWSSTVAILFEMLENQGRFTLKNAVCLDLNIQSANRKRMIETFRGLHYALGLRRIYSRFFQAPHGCLRCALRNCFDRYLDNGRVLFSPACMCASGIS